MFIILFLCNVNLVVHSLCLAENSREMTLNVIIIDIQEIWDTYTDDSTRLTLIIKCQILNHKDANELLVMIDAPLDLNINMGDCINLIRDSTLNNLAYLKHNGKYIPVVIQTQFK